MPTVLTEATFADWPNSATTVKSERPLFHSLHRAWTACVGLPKYDKDAWFPVEREAWRVEKESGDPRPVLLAIEALLTQQGGEYDPT